VRPGVAVPSSDPIYNPAIDQTELHRNLYVAQSVSMIPMSSVTFFRALPLHLLRETRGEGGGCAGVGTLRTMQRTRAPVM